MVRYLDPLRSTHSPGYSRTAAVWLSAEDAKLPGGMRVHQILKRSRGWTLLLFEGPLLIWMLGDLAVGQ